MFFQSIYVTFISSTKKVEQANKLLICGTSVFVFSAYRLCLKANELGKEIGILNVGETRADKFSKFKFETNDDVYVLLHIYMDDA